MIPSQFYQRYGSEENCIEFLYSIYKDSVRVCSHCKCEILKWYAERAHWRCTCCKKKITLKSISFMRDSKVSFRQWTEVIFLLLETKKTLSIAEIHRLTGMKRYGTVFYMVHKIRVELGRLNKKEFLDKSSILPIDKKMKVEPVNLPEYLNIRYGKEVNHTLDKIYLIVPYNWKLNSSLEQLQKICCVGYRYKKVLKNSLSTFRGRQFERRKLEQKWSSNLSGNLIREIEGIYHNISPLHFQKVLDEYCFKYNYRHSRKGKFLSFFYLISGKG